MSRFSVISFDCDGVMFDTAAANRMFYDRILAALDRPPMTDDQFAFVHMHTVDESLAHLLPDPADYQRAQAVKAQMSYLPLIGRMKMEPDLVALLKWLRPAHKTAVATNRSDTMNRVLVTHQLEGLFDLVVQASDVPRPKPAPDMLQRICDRFDVGPAQVLYIGDSELDQRAADAARVCFAAYRNPALEAAYHIRRLSAVVDIVSGSRQR